VSFKSSDAVEKHRQLFLDFGKAINDLYPKHEVTAYHHVISCHAFGQLKELLNLSKVSQQGKIVCFFLKQFLISQKIIYFLFCKKNRFRRIQWKNQS